MKLIILLASLIISVQASSTTLEEARNSKNIIAEAPSVYFSGNAVSALNVCIQGNHMRTKEEISLYMWQEGDEESPSLTNPQYFYTKRNYKKAMVDGDGTVWVNRSYPQVVKVKLIEADTYREDYETVIETIEYTLPNCDSL